IFRGGFLSVPHGQLEAASMLGYSRLQIVTKIELPQMRALITPPITNQMISLVKDSALLSMLTIADLTKAATQMANETFVFAEPFLAIAVLYWLLNASVAHAGGIIENKARAYQ
ncbi:ABC transporter permease subunit, partial [Mesorhizobium sp. M7A.F.Ca.US.011.01.1.1]|uniref:ABC transporter permease subunit n=1 Tax=Mesorhizobium sp. M7A.F.Ca.US.011.01.1.1 TaxID=2496741 RepID=UPI000FCAF9EC